MIKLCLLSTPHVSCVVGDIGEIEFSQNRKDSTCSSRQSSSYIGAPPNPGADSLNNIAVRSTAVDSSLDGCANGLKLGLIFVVVLLQSLVTRREASRWHWQIGYSGFWHQQIDPFPV